MSDAITRLNAALSDRYTIERELGEGGMAMVYLAADVKQCWSQGDWWTLEKVHLQEPGRRVYSSFTPTKLMKFLGGKIT